jgi:hypothetical protein
MLFIKQPFSEQTSLKPRAKHGQNSHQKHVANYRKTNNCHTSSAEKRRSAHARVSDRRRSAAPGRGRQSQSPRPSRCHHVHVAYRHSLRAAELTDLRWDQIEFSSATLHVRRVKQGTLSTHPIIATSCAPYADFSANRPPSLRSCSRQSAARHSRRQAS